MVKVTIPRVGRVPQWPEYIPRSYPERVLAVFRNDTLFLETGDTLTVQTFASLIELLFSKNLLVFVDNLAMFKYLKDFVEHEYSDVICNREGHATSILINMKKSQRWIVPCRTWERSIDEDFLCYMRMLFDYCGVGPRPTPSSLGVCILRRYWGEAKLKKHTSPNRLCANFIYSHRCGGRCDTFSEGVFFDKLIDLDMSTAYLAHFLELPTGTSIRFLNDDCWDFFTFFAECEITIHKELALGCFPFKKQEKRSKIVYPTLPGTYKCFLWREQVEDALIVGCSARVLGGYGWEDSTRDTEDICRWLYAKRVNAPLASIEKDIKKIIVSTIGRFGMHSTYYNLVTEEEAYEEETCLVGEDNHGYNFYIHEINDYKKPAMQHWYAYDLMQCSRTLYKYALPYAEQGRLVMTNYDSMLVVDGDDIYKQYVKKHTLEAKMCEMGDLRYSILTNVTILGPRSVKCDQYVKNPSHRKLVNA